jgi:Pyrimidine operon attenuation protein/uracil phosphoribosyltransferase
MALSLFFVFMAQEIMTTDQSAIAVRRMAYQVAEYYFGIPQLVVLGLIPRGRALAELLVEELNQLEHAPKLQFHYLEKQQALPPELSPQLAGKPVLLVDDVLFSGNTLFEALEAVMSARPSSVQVAVLVDRGDRLVPISPIVVGLELGATRQQYVTVELTPEGQGLSAWLHDQKPPSRS